MDGVDIEAVGDALVGVALEGGGQAGVAGVGDGQVAQGIDAAGGLVDEEIGGAFVVAGVQHVFVELGELAGVGYFFPVFLEGGDGLALEDDLAAVG